MNDLLTALAAAEIVRTNSIDRMRHTPRRRRPSLRSRVAAYARNVPARRVPAPVTVAS